MTYLTIEWTIIAICLMGFTGIFIGFGLAYYLSLDKNQ